MGKYMTIDEISRLVAGKKNYIYRILIVSWLLISVSVSIIGSYALFQYESTKVNFIENKYAKTVEIDSYSEQANDTRNLDEVDLVNIKEILEKADIKIDIMAEKSINFGITTQNDDVVFIKYFSGNLFYNQNNQGDNFLLSKKTEYIGELELKFPVINIESGGYTSDKVKTKKFVINAIDDNQLINYVRDDEILVSEKVFLEISDIMFPKKKEISIERIYVNVNEVSDVSQVANLLSNYKYNTNFAFKYYENFSDSIQQSTQLSFIVLLVLLGFNLIVIVSVFEITLKNSVGDIAILKHMGFSVRKINKIYMLPVLRKFTLSILLMVLINLILNMVDVIDKKLYIFIFSALNMILVIISFIIMLWRLNYYSKQSVIKLLKEFKVEE